MVILYSYKDQVFIVEDFYCSYATILKTIIIQMKKCYSNLIVSKLQLFALLFTAGFVLAQQSVEQEKETKEDVVISYNTPFSYSLNPDVSWKLTNSTGNLINQGKGDFVNNVFAVPGDYVLSIQEKHTHNEGSCDHDQYPSKLNIKVSTTKMEFDWSTLKFSKNIAGGQSAKGITVTVDVLYSSAENENAVYEHGFKTAGVGTSIVGTLKDKKTILKPGVNKLAFLLDGVAEKGNYIMLDFKDVNGQVQSYTLTQKIK